jgi:hypothetical protein
MLNVPLGTTAVSVRAFGPKDAENYGLQTWSLAKLQSQEDVPSNRRLMQAIQQELVDFGITKRAFAPHVSPASAAIVETERLTKRISFRGKEPVLFRNGELPADGIPLQPGEGFLMSNAGCAVVCAAAGGHLYVLHAGRASLMPTWRIEGGTKEMYPTLIENIVTAFDGLGIPAPAIHMTMLLAIGVQHQKRELEHPIYGAYNRKLRSYLRSSCIDATIDGKDYFLLDLERVFVEQARLAGIKKVSALCSLEQFPELVQRSDSPERNLVIVRRGK